MHIFVFVGFLLPALSTACAARPFPVTSSGVHFPLTRPGFSWWCHRSRHCFPTRPAPCPLLSIARLMAAHLVPSRPTSAVNAASSCGARTPTAHHTATKATTATKAHAAPNTSARTTPKTHNGQPSGGCKGWACGLRKGVARITMGPHQHTRCGVQYGLRPTQQNGSNRASSADINHHKKMKGPLRSKAACCRRGSQWRRPSGPPLAEPQRKKRRRVGSCIPPPPKTSCCCRGAGRRTSGASCRKWAPGCTFPARGATAFARPRACAELEPTARRRRWAQGC